MISVETAVYIHAQLITEFGGSNGTRDLAGLEAALARPFATFDQHELYPDAISKAAALLESLIINHPFIDGNKRIAFTLMLLLLTESGHSLTASENEIYDFVIKASTGDYRIDEIKTWLLTYIK